MITESVKRRVSDMVNVK